MWALKILPFFFLGIGTALPTEATSSSAAAISCPASVSDKDLIPTTMVHVTQVDGDKKHSTTTTGAIKPKDMCTWFAFNVPGNKPDSLCVLSFTFPDPSTVNFPDKWNFTGPGNFDIRAFYALPDDYDVSRGMTWDTQPQGPSNKSEIYEYKVKLGPNQFTVINSGPCSKSRSSAQTLYVRMCSADTEFVFPESTTSANNQCPVGLFVLVFPKAGQPVTPASSSPPSLPIPSGSGGVGLFM